MYSMCRTGARAAPPSTDSATRVPGAGDHQDERVAAGPAGAGTTISWITAARSGVRWSAVRAPTVGQARGVQATVAVVRGRVEMLRAVVVNAPALSAACAGDGQARARRSTPRRPGTGPRPR